MKKFFAVCAGMLAACTICANLSASAYTADDVAAKARAAGWPENVIQIGYNQWASGQYTQEQLDEAYASVMDYNEQTEEFVYNSLGMTPPEHNETPQPEETTPPETTPNENATPNENVNPDSSSDANADFIPESDFINMTMEEKQEYVSSLEEDKKQEFVASLSPEARNSIIKQLPTQDKITIMQKYIDTADSMGMNVTVDEITDKDISVTVRNNDGVVIDKAEVGVVIDETGISHTKPFLFAGIGIFVSSVGFIGLYEYIRRTENQ